MWRAALRLRHAAPCATLAALTRCDDDAALQKRTTWKASSDKLGPPRVHRIVITGGPCAGKTTAMAKLSLRLQNMGFDVFVVPEVRDAAWKGASIWLVRHLHESSPSDESSGPNLSRFGPRRLAQVRVHQQVRRRHRFKCPQHPRY